MVRTAGKVRDLISGDPHGPEDMLICLGYLARPIGTGVIWLPEKL